MAQIRSTRYVCDACEKDVPAKRDLRKFGVQVRVGNWPETTTDLCEECETLMISALGAYFVPDHLSDLRREEKR